MPALIDIAGRKFGRLTVLEYCGKKKWLCTCSCGEVTAVCGSLLRSGNTRSCGCLRREVVAATYTIHGMSNTPEYWIWNMMKTRCRNKRNRWYQYYGGRGISVCRRWNDFNNFLLDVGLRPHKRLSIDRIDNNGDYEPGNCRWATLSQQRNNRRNREEVARDNLKNGFTT